MPTKRSHTCLFIFQKKITLPVFIRASYWIYLIQNFNPARLLEAVCLIGTWKQKVAEMVLVAESDALFIWIRQWENYIHPNKT